MCYLKLKPTDFNPRVLYTFKKTVIGNTQMNSHSHDFTSLIFILEGKCRYIIDGVEYPVQEGNLIIISPYSLHERVILPTEHVVEFHVGFNNFCIKGLPDGYIQTSNLMPITMINSYKQTFTNCCEEIINEQNKNEPYKPLIIKALVMKLITLIIRENALTDCTNQQTSITIEKTDRAEIVQAIINYMNENYAKDISLSKLSQNMYLSSVYISKIFKEEIGDSPINYLIQIRLAKACELLEQNRGLSIKEIAQIVGYQDAYYFSKLFKKYYGASPSKYIQISNIS